MDMQDEMARKIAKIGKRIPKDLKDRGIIEERPLQEQADRLREMSRHRSTNKRAAQQMEETARHLESKVVHKMDDKVHNRIEKEWEGRLKVARERGEIPSEKEARRMYNQFMKSRNK